MSSSSSALKPILLLAVTVVVTVAVMRSVGGSGAATVATAAPVAGSTRDKPQLLADIPAAADIYTPAELAWCTTVSGVPERFLTLHCSRFVNGISSGPSVLAIHHREARGYRTVFRHQSPDGYAISDAPLVGTCRVAGEGASRHLVYAEDWSTGTDGNSERLLLLLADAGVQEVEWPHGTKLPLASDEDTLPPEIGFRGDGLSFRYPVCRIHDPATRSVGAHVADLVGTYRLAANPPVGQAQHAKPFRLEIATIRRVPAAKGD
jgi:hypothetical protein